MIVPLNEDRRSEVEELMEAVEDAGWKVDSYSVDRNAEVTECDLYVFK